MWGGMGKGESKGQSGIKRQAQKEKGKQKENQNQARIILFKALHWSWLTLWDINSFELKGCDRANGFHPDQEICPEANASWLHSGGSRS